MRERDLMSLVRVAREHYKLCESTIVLKVSAIDADVPVPMGVYRKPFWDNGVWQKTMPAGDHKLFNAHVYGPRGGFKGLIGAKADEHGIVEIWAQETRMTLWVRPTDLPEIEGRWYGYRDSQSKLWFRFGGPAMNDLSFHLTSDEGATDFRVEICSGIKTVEGWWAGPSFFNSRAWEKLQSLMPSVEHLPGDEIRMGDIDRCRAILAAEPANPWDDALASASAL